MQSHTQCVSEAEKYGPKSAGCVIEAPKARPKEKNLDGPAVDLSIGLSTRAPWSCSLCNVKATSQETLILHSQGKKHRSKTRSTLAKSSAISGSESVTDGTLVTKEMVSSGPPKNPLDLTEGQTTEFLRSESLRKGLSADSNLEANHLAKELSSKLEDCQNELEAKPSSDRSDANGISSLHNSRINGSSIEQGAKRKQRKRKVADELSHMEGVETIHGKKKNHREDAKVMDCMNENMKGKAKDIHAELHGNNGYRFEQEPSEGGYNRKVKSSKHKSLKKDRNGLVESFEHEESYVSWEQHKDIPEFLLNVNEKGKVVDSSVDLANKQRHHSSPENWSRSIKWKKLIKKTLKYAPNGSLTMKQLFKALLPIITETNETSGVLVDEASLRLELENQVHSYGKLVLYGKKVRLANNDSKMTENT